MVSDFTDEKNGYLKLTQEEYEEYEEAKEGYWTSERFMEQIKEVVNKIVEVQYSKDEGRKVVWVFVHSSCYAACLMMH